MTAQIKQEIDSIVSQLVASYQPEKIILFGSYLGEKTHKDSDVDLLIVKLGVDAIKRSQRYYEARKLISTNLAVDILVYTPYELKKRLYIGDPFIEHITKKGKILYATPTRTG